MALGVEDDSSVVRRKLLEAAVAAPVLPDPEPHRGGDATRRRRSRLPLPAAGAASGTGRGLGRRTRRISRYQNILTARATAAATPIRAETSMLPVPGSR